MSSTQCNTTIPVGTAAEMLARLTDTISYGIDGQVPSRTRPVADLIDAIASAPGMEPINEHNRFFKGATRQWKSLADEARRYPTSIAGIPPHHITSEILSRWDQLYAQEQTWRMLTYLVRMYADVIPDSPHICSYIDDLANGVPGLEDTLRSYRPHYR